jgi:hypothetical protein
MSEEAEACFVLPLREASAHFACRNARSAEAEMGRGSNDGNTHASIDMTHTDLGIKFLPFSNKQGGRFLQQSFGLVAFFAEETICRL